MRLVFLLRKVEILEYEFVWSELDVSNILFESIGIE
jgi:hypothetical protein